ncbi:MAG: MFS transporter [Rhizobiaceae bacterium]
MPAVDEARRAERRLVNLLGVAQICSWGSLFYSFPLVAQAMGPELGWSKPEIYGAATLGLALAGLAAYPVGAAIDRGHGRAVMTLGSFAAGLLLIAWSQVTEIAVFYVIFAAIGCLHAATLYEPAFAVIARHVGAADARRGITALTLWGGFASTVFIPLIQVLVDGLGWRGALIVLGAINIVVCAGLQWLVIDSARAGVPQVHAPEAFHATGRQVVGQALRKPVFWMLMLALVAYSAAFSALTFHLYPLLLEKGLDAPGVVAVMAVIGPAQVAGRIVVWLFAPRAPVRAVGSAVVLVFPLAVAAIWLAPPDMLLLATVAIAYGAANGIMTIVRGLAVPEMVSRDAYGAVNGALLGPMHLAQALAPLAAAWLWAQGGGYAPVLVAIFVGAVVLCLGFWGAASLSRRWPI